MSEDGLSQERPWSLRKAELLLLHGEIPASRAISWEEDVSDFNTEAPLSGIVAQAIPILSCPQRNASSSCTASGLGLRSAVNRSFVENLLFFFHVQQRIRAKGNGCDGEKAFTVASHLKTIESAFPKYSNPRRKSERQAGFLPTSETQRAMVSKLTDHLSAKTRRARIHLPLKKSARWRN